MKKCSKDRFSSDSSGFSDGSSFKGFDASSFSDASPFGDPGLQSFSRIIRERAIHAHNLEKAITSSLHGEFQASHDWNLDKGTTLDHPRSLYDFADYHLTFGLFQIPEGWLFREWAPHAKAIFILNTKSDWQPHPEMLLERKTDGIFEGRFPKNAFSHKDLYRLKVRWDGGEGDRIPTAARRVVQDPHTLIFNAQVWAPEKKFLWSHPTPQSPTDIGRCQTSPPGPLSINGEGENTVKKVHAYDTTDPLLIYEAHVGMALEEARVGTYREFQKEILPKIKDAGYTAIQLMAIPEHPYYASFGYHVSSFFAPSSRFGTPDELKSLIDAAHGMGFLVLMDIVHSHSVRNEVEGISRFDGTPYQFFHAGSRGYHRLWDSRCFNYDSLGVIQFLLSNLRYWLDEFNVDGFRFDGITSMLFLDHGLDRAFTGYADYFGSDIDQNALSYLTLANQLIHEINARAITIAEDVSGYPGLAAPIREGGAGFDFRFAMGIADHWIKLVKDTKDENWEMGRLWYELTTRRKEERTLSYAECHDQALVGDQTLMMRLMGDRIYTAMDRQNRSMETYRAVALHKMIRLITLASADAGYLTFMGNEFGHPEWVDFPSEQNGFSFYHARRQWSLQYNADLYFNALSEFDREMISMAKTKGLFSCQKTNPASPTLTLLKRHEADKVIAFERKGLIFAFNFHPTASYTDYHLDAPPGKYTMILDTDEERFGGPERLQQGQVHFTTPRSQTPTIENKMHYLSIYLPSRCALVLSPS